MSGTAGALKLPNPSSIIPVQVSPEPESGHQGVPEPFHLFELEAMGLERDAGPIGRAVVHEPCRHRGRCQKLLNLDRHDLSAAAIEAVPPEREDSMRSRDELHARVKTVIEPLIEVMQRHRREVGEDLTLPRGERHMRRLVLDEQPMVMAVPGDTSIAEQRAYQDCLLELGQLARLCLDFPRRHPTRSIGWDFHRYSRVWHRRYRRRGQD